MASKNDRAILLLPQWRRQKQDKKGSVLHNLAIEATLFTGLSVGSDIHALDGQVA